ncbi:hypothetical protein BJ165DRAFT_196670 [Panaeolus papilionaceus]|nr:hypothetical protein BJ165DRAFT_196670 [Panaeolus papilionaceus]
MFDSPKAYLVPSIQYAVLDPQRPPAARLSPNISSLRLSTAFDTAEFHVEADQRGQTVFAGFSTVGGLFTFVSGMFAVIFGTTFLRILFDMRELSIFGIAQRWDRKKIVKAYLDAYPSLRAELELENSRRGVVAVLQDHLLDTTLFRRCSMPSGGRNPWRCKRGLKMKRKWPVKEVPDILCKGVRIQFLVRR